MARFCTNCGNQIPDGVVFCTECGTRAPSADVAVKEAQQPTTVKELPRQQPPQQVHTQPQRPQPQPQYAQAQSQPAYVQPRQTQPAQAAADPTSKVVSTGAFFGLQFLFSIPLLGWLICLIMAFAPKNKNIKHYARAVLIWILIGIILSVGLFFLFKWIGGLIGDFITPLFSDLTSQFSGITDGLGDLGDLLGDLGELGDLTDGLGDLTDGLGDLPVE